MNDFGILMGGEGGPLAGPTKASHVFHKMWTACVGKPGYYKVEWLDLSRRMDTAESNEDVQEQERILLMAEHFMQGCGISISKT